EAPKKKAPTKREKPAAPPVLADADEFTDTLSLYEGEVPVDPYILNVLKDCGASDQHMSDGLGVARSTYNNHAKGKKPLVLDFDQTCFIRDDIVRRINNLGAALNKLDGTEVPLVE